MSDELVPSVRLDVWLWAARFFKTRALSKQAIENHRVEVAGAAAKPSRAVRVGDRVAVTRGSERYEIDVLGLSDTRGPAPVAQALYAETAASVAAREAERERRRAEGGPVAPPKRPDKKARRQIKSFKGDNDGLPPWFPR
ncbi:RNA-binding S4 domain-containing protein [Coralloluteibacterium stylophorae]|uniref:Heat shock protein 15 n=1 Tax=Coralloluteibacterium stylophorae TaxID=1776034 RepID=A0A8J8AXY7_9GAMM|nr:RNA-binding S4 domain-containing protein [Coralloluteibacterium stylophorae]MBS7458867.1 RNA-binding S4 domain-containing protein [Coralloluteibacterium stylophorae]